MSDIDFPEIYLQADVDADYAGEGRLWCQDDVWSGEPENSAPTKYIRSDLYDAARARIAELEAALEAQMRSTTILLRRHGYDDRTVDDCTSQARAALSETAP